MANNGTGLTDWVPRVVKTTVWAVIDRQGVTWSLFESEASALRYISEQPAGCIPDLSAHNVPVKA